MTWSAPSAFAFSILSSLPTVVITRRPDRLGELDRGRADAAAAGLDEDGLARRSSFALSNSMCSGVPKVTGAQRRRRRSTPSGAGMARRAVRLIAPRRQAVDMEAADAAGRCRRDCRGRRGKLAQGPQVSAPKIADLLAELAGRSTPSPSGGDRPRRLDADDDRQLPLGEGHAAPAPDVDVVERDGADPDLHLAGPRRRRIGQVDDGEACGLSSKPADCARIVWSAGPLPYASESVDISAAGSAEMIRQAFWPPKPKELDSTTADLLLPRHVGHHVELDARVGHLVVDRRRHHAARAWSCTENTASSAPAAVSVWPIIDLLELIGTVAQALAEHRLERQHFHLVVLGRAGAVGVDVVDLVRVHAGVVESVWRSAPIIAEPSGLERVRWKSSAFSAAPRITREDLGPARHGRVVVLQHQRRRAFGDDETVAVLRERPRRLLGDRRWRRTAPRAARSASPPRPSPSSPCRRRAPRSCRRAGSPRRRAGSRSRPEAQAVVSDTGEPRGAEPVGELLGDVAIA